MKTLYESLLDNLDDLEKSIDLKKVIKNWIENNYGKITLLKISDKPNKDGKYEVSANHVIIDNKSLTSLTNDMFVWKNVRLFNCSNCTSLTSLEGAPEKVGGDFNCSHCNSLTSLKGAPKEVGGDFYCCDCTSLTSYELPKGTKIKGKIYK